MRSGRCILGKGTRRHRGWLTRGSCSRQAACTPAAPAGSCRHRRSQRIRRRQSGCPCSRPGRTSRRQSRRRR
eukprot:scaffold78571_cov48-Phaeocystis_antarctica.AAC.1